MIVWELATEVVKAFDWGLAKHWEPVLVPAKIPKTRWFTEWVRIRMCPICKF